MSSHINWSPPLEWLPFYGNISTSTHSSAVCLQNSLIVPFSSLAPPTGPVFGIFHRRIWAIHSGFYELKRGGIIAQNLNHKIQAIQVIIRGIISQGLWACGSGAMRRLTDIDWPKRDSILFFTQSYISESLLEKLHICHAYAHVCPFSGDWWLCDRVTIGVDFCSRVTFSRTRVPSKNIK